uniref:CDP-diglyceride synthetase n=1 Tax=Micromonospora robiginosa TaxID=2749844 RepID=A0A7L6B8F4_9ACTN
MFPSTSRDSGREPWADDPSTGPSGPARGYPPAPRTGPAEEEPAERRERKGPRRLRKGGPGRRSDDDADESPEEETPPVEFRRPLALTVAGFAALLGTGLVLGAQTAGPGHRLPFAVIIFGVQMLYVLAWTMAMRPPALLVVALVSAGAAALADVAAVQSDVAGLAPLGYAAVAGLVLGVLGQLVRRVDRVRVTDSLGGTLLIVVGVVAFASLIVLSRIPKGTQAITVCLTAAGVALLVARLTDAVAPWPRLAPQVPRGAAGVVVGAMLGTLTSAVLGSYLVGFTPTSAALVGVVTAATAVLADLAVGYAEAGRLMAGEAPTMWVARHMQGPLGGFALAAPAAYAMCVLFL